MARRPLDPLWTGLLEQMRLEGSRSALLPMLDELTFLGRGASTLRASADARSVSAWRRDGRLQALRTGVSQHTSSAYSLAILPSRGSLAGDPTQSLEAFIPSPANQATRARLDDLVQHAGRYPALVRVCGPTGSGKTHVLLGIANALAAQAPHQSVLCADAEDLSLALAGALRQSALGAFRAALTQVDVLLLDAVDRLADKEETQLELLASLDLLLAQPALVVMTLRDPAGNPALLPELHRRVQQSALLELAAPRFETRVAIAMERANAWDLDLRPDAAALLVQHAGDHLREIDLLLTHIAAHPACESTVDVELARRVLGESLRPREPLPTDVVLDIISRHLGVRGSELRAQSRTARASTPRQITMYLLREHCDLSYPQIGRVLHRHHTTVMHGYNRIVDLREANTGLSATISLLEKEIERVRERGG